MDVKNIITVTSPLLPDLDDLNVMLREIWDKKWITNNGEFHQRFEAALCEYLKVPYISVFTNDGLHLMGKGYLIWRDALRPHLK